MKINKILIYFLVDDGEGGGGMFLTSSYKKFIGWQNIDDIIGKNKISGKLNSHISQSEKEIDFQEAIDIDIINIDENYYSYFDYLISCYQIRNIFGVNDITIYYKNYNDVKYNYDLIEEALGKIIISAIKKFKSDKIKFVTYIYE